MAIIIFRTPVRWLKFRPAKPMGEILEEGDKDDGEKKEGGEVEEGADKPATTEKKDGGTEEPAVVKEVFVWNHSSCNLLFKKIYLSIQRKFWFEGSPHFGIPVEGFQIAFYFVTSDSPVVLRELLLVY